MIKKPKLIKLIEPYFIKDLLHDDHEIKFINATKLLTHTRFYNAFKFLHLGLRKKTRFLIISHYTNDFIFIKLKKKSISFNNEY